jgi:hypothetical protein
VGVRRAHQGHQPGRPAADEAGPSDHAPRALAGSPRAVARRLRACAKKAIAEIAEFGDHIYITSPVSVFTPELADLETLAFNAEVKSLAPNPKIMWMRGQYVEADNANTNGDQWTAGELAIKELTPVLMPITVMHDFRTAVGTIADAKLLTPDKDQVPRSRIDTVLALWAHRFPDVAEEAVANAEMGTLMQSMECQSPDYECSACGQIYQRLAGGAERENWCGHLKGDTVAEDGRAAARILRHVTFTGVGLIFGTRGARGAYPEAHLEVEELAARHREAHTATASQKPQPRRKNLMEIEDSRFQELVAAEAKLKQVEPELATEKQARTEAEERCAPPRPRRSRPRRSATPRRRAREKAEETANEIKLRDERMGKLGAGFVAKIDKMPSTKEHLLAQASSASEADWEGVLARTEESSGVKRDATLTDNPDPEKPEETAAEKDLLFDREVVAQRGGRADHPLRRGAQRALEGGSAVRRRRSAASEGQGVGQGHPGTTRPGEPDQP